MTEPLPLQIGYGPPGRVEHSAAAARGLTCFGLGIPFGVVFGLTATIAVDTGRTPTEWLGVAAAALALGLVASLVIGRAATNLGASIGSLLALFSVLAAGAWIALFNTGDPTAVDALVAVGLGASVPMLALAGIDALTQRPTARPIAAIGQPAAATLAGAATGAFVMFIDPTIVWSDVTAVGGVVAALGAIGRYRLPDRLLAAVPAADPAQVNDSPVGVRVLLTSSLGIAAAGVVRMQPFLAEQWQAGVRYHLLSIAIGGLAGAAVLIGFLWLPARLARTAATEIDDSARLALLVGATMLLVAISQTLPGTVAGTGAAAGVGLAGIALVAAAGARGDSGRAAVTVAAVTGLGAWVLTWVGWTTLVDAVGSERGVFALVAVPALAAGGIVSIRPLGVDAPEPAPNSAVLVGTFPAGEAPAGAGDIIDLVLPSSNGHSRDRRVLLEVRGVEFSYGAVQVLFGVDLQVRQGEVVALLGTNGAGKTTFLRTVAGLATPSSGSIRMAGGDLARFSASDRVLLGINQIAAGAAVAPDLTVAENLAMFGHTLKGSDARSGAARALEVFPRLAERQGQRASALSGGERQMLALSKSLVLRPRLLIIDECTLGLAPIAVASLVPVIRQLHAEGSSVLLVEQSVHLALDLADRASCMEKGRIVYESGADELRADPGLLESVYLEGITAALEHRVGASGTGPVT